MKSKFYKILSLFSFFLVIFFQSVVLSAPAHSREKDKNEKTITKLPPNFLWCGSSDNNTYLDFCFSSEKVCKDFALKRRETNGGKLTMCRPSKIK